MKLHIVFMYKGKQAKIDTKMKDWQVNHQKGNSRITKEMELLQIANGNQINFRGIHMILIMAKVFSLWCWYICCRKKEETLSWYIYIRWFVILWLKELIIDWYRYLSFKLWIYLSIDWIRWIAISLGLLSVYLKSLPGPVQDVGLLNGSVNWSGLYDIT